MFWGIIYFIGGAFMFVIPVVGWILGSLFMIAGIANLATPDSNDSDVYYVNETASTSVTEQLQQLSEVYEKGHISEEEFMKSKEKLLKQI